MRKYGGSSVLVVLFLYGFAWPQTSIETGAYRDYLSSHANISASDLMQEYDLENTYYRNLGNYQPAQNAAFYDSVVSIYDLTADEQALLNNNHFVVTERIWSHGIGFLYEDIYNKDLPVMLTTDAVLLALHTSYDQMLRELEIYLMEPILTDILQGMYNKVPELQSIHNDTLLQAALGDVDLYVSMALSLLMEQKQPIQTNLADSVFDVVWNAVKNELPAYMSLFSEHERFLDFSQFTVRGHYTSEYWQDDDEKTQAGYFQAMMWLGRIDFWLTPPPDSPFDDPWSWQDLQRMTQATLLMNELLDLSGARTKLQQAEDILTFYVGESDNLSPAELAGVITDNQITLESIADSSGFAAFQTLLTASEDYGQRILGSMLLVDPFSDAQVLPVSYKLMGQRFIIDSYALGNVVFPNIIYNGNQVKRFMPDPMDAMFVIGNNNTLPLLQHEIDEYHYAQNLAGLRYLVDSYDSDFWGQSLYNTWLSAIRCLNPTQDLGNYPLFMQTAAWQHKELNTQLASWAQLRHDNILYAKQSYSGLTGCSYPHSYIEPYPELYHAIQQFADRAEVFLATYSSQNTIIANMVKYYKGLSATMVKLEGLSTKELLSEPFDDQEKTYLADMMYVQGLCGDPSHYGWFGDLFYNKNMVARDGFTIADVHTQTDEEWGLFVGNILHVGVGNFNLGFFVAPSPSNDFVPTVFAGPVMSYYEIVTPGFDRLTDEEWRDQVTGPFHSPPARPDWVNIYLVNKVGNAYGQGRELPSEFITGVEEADPTAPQVFAMSDNYPNPFNPSTTISYTLPAAGNVELSVIDITGRRVGMLVHGNQPAGVHHVAWNAGDMASGVYFFSLRFGDQRIVKKMTLLK